MTWHIDRDYQDRLPNEGSKVGTEGYPGGVPTSYPKIRFRLLDDDGEVYYGGWLHDDPDCMNQSYAYDWGAWDSGTAHIEVKRNGEWVEEIG